MFYEYNGTEYNITLHRQPDGTLKAVIGEREYIVSATPIGSSGWLLHVNGTQFKLDKVEGRRKSKGSAGGGDLTAAMPGQVLDVRVAEGDVVSNGQVLVVLEAMKMEIRVTAPHDGTVSKLLVKVGDVVERGQRLVEVSQ